MADADMRVWLDKQACAELVHRMARAIDRCDGEGLRALFHADATDDHGVYAGSAAGFADWVIPVLEGMKRTQHFIGNILIETHGDVAFGESYFIAHHVIRDEADGEKVTIAAGRYLDRFERRDGAWRFAYRQAVYDWSAAAPSTDSWNRDAPGPMRFGARGARDLSVDHFAGRLSPGRAD